MADTPAPSARPAEHRPGQAGPAEHRPERGAGRSAEKPATVGPAEALGLGASDKAGRYRELLLQLRSLVEGEPDLIANLANLSAALMQGIEAASWVGFYILRGGELVLGPFQGKVACVRIPLGRGVCGTAAAERRTVLVPDVHAFAGHIACDPDSQSEIVVPVLRDGELLGVLDLDSNRLAAFDEMDAARLAEVAELAAGLRW